MAPNRRGPDKQKRKRALASFKQNAKTQKKRHENKLATAAEGTAHLDAFGTRGTNRGDPEDTGPGSVDAATTTAAKDDYHGAKDGVRNEVGARPHRDEILLETIEDDDGNLEVGKTAVGGS